MWYAFRIEPYRPRVSVHRLPVRCWPGTSRLRLVQLSDLHLWQWGRLCDTVLRHVEDARPDVILLTGDYAESEPGLEALERLCCHLVAMAPVYAVLGDNDQEERTHERRLEELFARTGVTLLRNEARLVERQGEALLIAGVDDPNTGKDRLEKARFEAELLLEGREQPDAVYAVLLAHSPEIVCRQVDGVWLILSGHTHGGQICLPGGKALYTNTPACKGYASGLYRMANGTALYVHRGVGTARIPARLFCPPEVAIFDLIGEGSE